MNERLDSVPLGEIADIAYGYTAKASFDIDGPRFLRITDIQNDAVDWESVPSCKLSKAEFEKHRLQDGDIVFARTGATTGKSYLVSNPPESVAASYLIRMRLSDERALPSFVAKFFQTADYWRTVADGISGSAQGGFNASKLAALTVTLPPLPEQRRIVAILDESFAAIATAVAHAEKNLKNARELFDSHLNAVFAQKGDGWVDATIRDHIKFIDYRGKTPKKIESGMRLITAKNVRMGYLQRSPEEFVDPNSYDSWMTRGVPKKGDVLFTTEAPLGYVAQLDTDEKVVFAQRVIIMQPTPRVLDATFLKFMLRSDVLQKRIHEKATGATATGIKASLLKQIQIAFPKLVSAQVLLAEKLDALEGETQRLETLYRRKLAALAELRQALLAKAFAGQLTAKHANNGAVT